MLLVHVLRSLCAVATLIALDGSKGDEPQKDARHAVEEKLEAYDSYARDGRLVDAFAALAEARELVPPDGVSEGIVEQKILQAGNALIANKDRAALRAVLDSGRISEGLRLQIIDVLSEVAARGHLVAERAAMEPRAFADCTVYLTFDDGPHYGTDDCLAVLAEKRVAGSFFVCGWNFGDDQGAGVVRFNKQTARETLSAGHLIGNHSYSHRYNYGQPDDFVRDFAERNVAEFRGVLGTTSIPSLTAVGRLPGRNSWRLGPNDPRNSDDPVGDTRVVADRLQAAGYKIYGWDVEWQFDVVSGGRDPRQTPQQMVDLVKQHCREPRRVKTPNKVIVLMHDNMFRQSRGNRVKLAQFVQGLKDAGFQFGEIDQY